MASGAASPAKTVLREIGRVSEVAQPRGPISFRPRVNRTIRLTTVESPPHVDKTRGIRPIATPLRALASSLLWCRFWRS